MFDKILIANRGEIAVRIIKTARKMGIKTAIVYSDADEESLAVEMADEKIHIGASPASQSYLDIEKIVAAAKKCGAKAIHPGFGFLSENKLFAQRLQKENIVFIGPNPYAIGAMGDKIESKKMAQTAGVSCVPGFMGEVKDVDHALIISAEIGYPVMIKASAGGGGKGIRIAFNDDEAREGFSAVRAEAKGAFGDDRIFIEKYIVSPRHIEIQVLGDKHGNIVHLFERECSIQRRNQKVIEEAPSPFLDHQTREKMGAQAVALAKAVNYDSAGTVEFVVSGQDKNFYFLEMNTRLQVEHPVTEMITGIDLVEQMIRVAYGHELSFKQDELQINGWAIESRVYAEDPYRGFLPSIGRLKYYEQPNENESLSGRIRVDSGVRAGDEISMYYDPMIAKLSCWGKTRSEAIENSKDALDDFRVVGISCNIPFLAAILGQERFASGNITTDYIKQEFEDGFKGVTLDDATTALIAGVAGLVHSRKRETELSAHYVSNGLPTNVPNRQDWVVVIDDIYHPIQIRPKADGAVVKFDRAFPKKCEAVFGQETRQSKESSAPFRLGRNGMRSSGGEIEIISDFVAGDHTVKGVANMNGLIAAMPFTVHFEDLAEGFKFKYRGSTNVVIVFSPRVAQLHLKLPPKSKANQTGVILSPMPGLIVAVEVNEGDAVKNGQSLIIVEAMKMQNIIRAERDGQVKSIKIEVGSAVAADEILLELA
jgi:propionyl-CoA carboxylase alpha chain